jgi:hypothetical protein
VAFSGGFQTGRGHKVNVSASSLQKARALFTDDESLNSNPNIDEQTEQGPDTKSLITQGVHAGFTTGSGKQVQVSEAGLRKANALLNVGEDDEPVPSSNILSFGNGGFQTGRGAKIQVSKEGLEKAYMLLSSEESSELDFEHANSRLPIIGGFQTGRGQKVEVSEQSLQKANTLLYSGEDFGIDSNDSAIEVGFQSGTEPLETAITFGDDPGPILFGNGSNFLGGFQTGRGNKVKVSEKALAVARNILDEGTSDSVDAQNEMGLVVFGSNHDEITPETVGKSLEIPFGC